MKNKKAKLRTEADKLWYQQCLYLRPYCECCEKVAIQVHHFFYKGNFGHLRYDLDNGISLCLGCHFKLHHQDPKLYNIEDKIIEKRGKKWAERLKKKAYTKPKSSYLNIKYYNNIIEELSK